MCWCQPLFNIAIGWSRNWLALGAQQWICQHAHVCMYCNQIACVRMPITFDLLDRCCDAHFQTSISLTTLISLYVYIHVRGCAMNGVCYPTRECLRVVFIYSTMQKNFSKLRFTMQLERSTSARSGKDAEMGGSARHRHQTWRTPWTRLFIHTIMSRVVIMLQLGWCTNSYACSCSWSLIYVMHASCSRHDDWCCCCCHTMCILFLLPNVQHVM